MKSIWIIAKNSFQEMIREKFFFVVIFVSLLLMGLSVLLGSLSLAEQKKILADLGFAAIELCSLGLVLFLGSFMISKEIEKQTCLVLLAKPLSRHQFLIGKWFGVVLLLSMTQVILATILSLLLWRPQYSLTFFEVNASLFFQTLVILSFVFFLSCWVRPIFSLLMGATIFLLGHWLNDLRFFAEKSKDESLLALFKIVHEATPQFYRFNWKSYYLLEKGVENKDFVLMIIYLSVWSLFLLMLAVSSFRRKDIV